MEAVKISESELFKGYSLNILPEFMMFDTSHDWATVSGTGSAVNSELEAYAGNRSLRLSNASGVSVFNSGDSQTSLNIDKDGNYVLSFRVKNTGDETSVTVGLYINSVLTEFTATIDENSDWECYYQLLPTLRDKDSISFSFSIDGASTLFIDGMKLEIERGGSGVPSIFSLPEPIYPTADGLYGLRVTAGLRTWELIPE